jgi:hypothetical protein
VADPSSRPKGNRKRPARINRYGALLGCPTVCRGCLSGEDRGDRQRRVRERDEHLDGAARVIEADAAEIGQPLSARS